VAISRVHVESPIGPWTVEGDGDGVTWVLTPKEARRPTGGRPAVPVRELADQLAQYFAGRRTGFDARLSLDGTDFELMVWGALGEIPYGETRTYGDVAAMIGRPSAYRAVGNANGRNRLPVVIPCHRVVASGGIGGYGSGLDVKRFLLEVEGVDSY
jgi:methylated-DNA-[protein]-cysteine S-methyltransferase